MDNAEIYDSDQMDVVVVSGTEVVEPKVISYQDSVDIIRKELNSAKDSFIRIGWHLKHVKQNKLYQQEEYKNIYEFAEDKFRLKKTTVSRFINLCEQFSINHDSPLLAEKYQGFSMSQLEELLPMKPEEKDKITSDMTVKQIRELKRERRAEGRKSENALEEIVATSQQLEQNTPLPAIEEEQPELPRLANSAERKAWLENVEEWGLWYEDANIQARYYKYDFIDGSILIAVKYRYTCPPYMKEQPEQYREQIESDDTYYGMSVYHMIYSDDYWEEHHDEYQKKYKRYYSQETVKISELVKFLKILQSKQKTCIKADEELKDDAGIDDIENGSLIYQYAADEEIVPEICMPEMEEWKDGSKSIAVSFDKSYISNGYIINEFDPDNLEKENNKNKSYITKKYIEFYNKKGYIPRYFNAYNCREITDTAHTLTTHSGTKQGSGSILFFYVKEEIVMILNDETIEEDRTFELIKKLLRIAAPDERKKAEEFLLECRVRL